MKNYILYIEIRFEVLDMKKFRSHTRIVVSIKRHFGEKDPLYPKIGHIKSKVVKGFCEIYIKMSKEATTVQYNFISWLCDIY